MASWIDILSLTATIAIVAGGIYSIIYVLQAIQNVWASTKEALKTKGLDVSHTGISVKTSRQLDREGYIDATHRGLVRVANASSFRKGENTKTNSSQTPPRMERDSSNSSSDGKKKKWIFGSRK